MRKITNEDENLDFVVKTWEVNGIKYHADVS